MSYAKIDVLDQSWNLFEEVLQLHIDPAEYHVSEIQKLMTEKSVIDLSKHAIYTHTEYVHQLTLHLLHRQNNHPNKCQSTMD